MNALLDDVSRLQRVRGVGRIALEARQGRGVLRELFQEGAAKIRLPWRDDPVAEAILINTAGGLTGGDRLRWQAEIGPEMASVLTTQACEKAYRSDGGTAAIEVRLDVEEAGRLAWLPQETIVYQGASLARRLDLRLAPGASALVLEATVFGRKAMGETVSRALFEDRWRVWRGERLVHAEAFRIGPHVADALGRPAVAGGRTAVATLLHVAEGAADDLDAARAIVGDMGGVSAWQVDGTGKLLARLVATDGYALRSRLVPLVKLLNGQAGLPKAWTL